MCAPASISACADFDSAVGGLGGCPYAPGAKGNVSTTALARMLAAEGWETGLDMDKLAAAEAYLAGVVAGLKE
jgi:hydroxymethylglutaryl-CoA lyase